MIVKKITHYCDGYIDKVSYDVIPKITKWYIFGMPIYTREMKIDSNGIRFWLHTELPPECPHRSKLRKKHQEKICHQHSCQ